MHHGVRYHTSRLPEGIKASFASCFGSPSALNGGVRRLIFYCSLIVRLTQIKLAGFKSFVEPTVIPTPSQLVGVVGPNGCGKSNIIDAVRWVLGESKASELRGESMQDVIFNCSGQRKPASRASVELVFVNSNSRPSGQWSNYSQN